jgi:ABC-type nitrate/sulfonate/bicarbonate transport system substrate-binding protein
MPKLAAATLAALAVLAGCGGDDAAEKSSEGRTKLVVGVIPIADVAPLYLGAKKGFFRAEGLDIEPRPIQGGAAAIPSLAANEFQIAFGNAISMLQAQQRGIELRIVTEGVQGGTSDKDSSNGMMVAKGSAIRRPADLAGRTIAVNTLDNLGEVTVRASLEKLGVDSSKVKFVEVPFPEMNTALERGSVDAAWHVEPFISQLLASGGRKLFDPFVETHSRLTPAEYFGAAEFLDEKPEVESGFRKAMNRSLDYAQEHEAEVRAEIPRYSEIPKAVAEKMPLPYWTSDLNEESIRQLARLAAKYGVLKGDAQVDAILPKE